MYERYKDIEKRKAYNREYQREYMRKRRLEGKIKKIDLKKVPANIRSKDVLCKKHGFYKHFLTNENRYKCKKCERDYIYNARKAFKIKCVKYLGGKCIGCGYSKHAEVLEFHHRDPSKKDFTIASHVKTWSRATAELDKCDLLCANCHREEHLKLYLTSTK